MKNTNIRVGSRVTVVSRFYGDEYTGELVSWDPEKGIFDVDVAEIVSGSTGVRVRRGPPGRMGFSTVSYRLKD